MRAVIQRVTDALLTIDNRSSVEISGGIVILLGIEESDGDEDISWLSGKISRLRIFRDSEGIMNLSVNEVQGEVLIVSQFTLHAGTRKGNRPSYTRAARPETAIPLYEKFIAAMRGKVHGKVVTGEFGAYMQIRLNNDGPVTIVIDTKNRE